MVTRRERWVRRLAVAAAVGMFLVLATGSTVTNTGSAEGCGRSWPLCHGEFIPAYAFETLIEMTHRVVTAVIGVVLLATAIGAYLVRGKRRATKVLIAFMMGSLIIQAGLGAAAVMWPQSPGLLAVHFGVSLICFASTFLLMRLIREPVDATTSRMDDLPKGYRLLAWGSVIGSLGVSYIGAYMRHSGNELACYTWPDCNGALIPDLTSPAGIAFSHRATALGLMLMVGWLWWWSRELRSGRPGLMPMANAAVVLIFLQALGGGLVVLTELTLWTTLLHAALMALLFVCLADLCRQSLPRRARAEVRPSYHAAPTPAD